MFTRVYVIGCQEVFGRVKIGYARNPRTRLRSLQSGSPVRLNLLTHFPGGPEMERTLHLNFADFRLHGEWFDFGKEDPVIAVRAAYEEFTANPEAAARLHHRPGDWVSYRMKFTETEWIEAGCPRASTLEECEELVRKGIMVKGYPRRGRW